MHADQKLKSLLLAVAQQNASDIHFVVGKPPTLRIDGRLHPLSKEEILTNEAIQEISNTMLNDERKKVLMEEGQVGFSYDFEKKARFRAHIFFQKGNVSIVMRLIQTKIRTLEELNMPSALYDLLKHSQGLVLVTGPVGHGKSTTMAALIDNVNHNFDKTIVTIEDPIEYLFQQDRCIINQREVGQDTKSFGDALRAVFREDANVIMIGEMRDLDTIRTTITAAETGHLIFATLHTNSSAETIDRITDVFPSHQQNQIRSQLSNVLLAVVSQRLIPKIGGGRIPAVEIMFNNNAIANLIREKRAYQIDSVIETNSKEGMTTLDKSLNNLVKKGLITVDDALTYSQNEEYLRMLMSK